MAAPPMIAVASGEVLPPELVGPLADHSSLLGDGAALRAALAEDGYVALPRMLPREAVLAARHQIFTRLAEVDEIADPCGNARYTGRSRRRELVADLGEFWRSVAESWALRRLTHGPVLYRVMETLFDCPPLAQDFIFLRPADPGKHTKLHCDYGFFTRETESVLTAWIALGDIPTRLGPLFVVENSHRFEDVIESQQGFDVVRDAHRTAAFEQSALAFVRERGTRILTRDFSAGDVVIFPMFTVHGSLDNVSMENEMRLSVDVRYQPAGAAQDPRYFGPDPSGTTGAGYGELTGAKPLTEAWHIR